MAEFQWWLLIVGLVGGGAIVALMMLDTSRRETDLADDERTAEAGFIAARLAADGRPVDADSVARVLQVHQDYLRLPPPDAVVPLSASDRDPDQQTHDVGDGGGSRADRDLPGA